jgi:hypothetical protein
LVWTVEERGVVVRVFKCLTNHIDRDGDQR